MVGGWPKEQVMYLGTLNTVPFSLVRAGLRHTGGVAVAALGML